MIRQGTHSKRPLIEAARELRQRSTEAEKVLWNMLRNRRLGGLKFRRQHQVGPFIVDFFCREKRLVIEADGAPHLDSGGQARDTSRTGILQTHGYTVLRFENQDVVVSPQFVADQILRVANQLRSPLPGGERGQG